MVPTFVLNLRCRNEKNSLLLIDLTFWSSFKMLLYLPPAPFFLFKERREQFKRVKTVGGSSSLFTLPGFRAPVHTNNENEN